MEKQRRSFSVNSDQICSTVFESFEKIIKEQMERQNERISKLKADVFPSGAGDESEACKISNAK